MEAAIPYQPSLAIGNTVDTKQGLQLRASSTGFEHRPGDAQQVNALSSKFVVVKSFPDVCVFLQVSPEYALKVKTGQIIDAMTDVCLASLEEKDKYSFHVLFCVQNVSTTTSISAADAASVDGTNSTHYISGLKSGNKLVISAEFHSKDNDLIEEVTETWGKTMKIPSGDTNVEALNEFAKKMDKKMKRRAYQDLKLHLQYCSFSKLEKSYSTLSGMVNTINAFIRCCQNTASGAEHQTAACMVCTLGTEVPAESTFTEAEADQDTSCGPWNQSSFKFWYFITAILTSFKTGVQDDTSSRMEECEKLFQYLLNNEKAYTMIQDFLLSDYCACKKLKTQGEQYKGDVKQALTKIKKLIYELTLVEMPSVESFTEIWEQDCLAKIAGFIKDVSSELPGGSDLNLLLIGRTGHGKSSSGNFILMKNTFEVSASSELDTVRSDDGDAEIDNRHITVVDTRGVGDTSEWTDGSMNAPVFDVIKKALSRHSQGFNALLLVIRFGQRMTQEERDTIKILQNVFGKEFIKDYVIFLITHGDDFQRERHGAKNASILDWCRSEKGFLGEKFEESDFRCVLFNNKTNDSSTIKSQLIKLIHLVDEISESGNNKMYDMAAFTKAQEMFKLSFTQEKKKNDIDETLPKKKDSFDFWEWVKAKGRSLWGSARWGFGLAGVGVAIAFVWYIVPTNIKMKIESSFLNAVPFYVRNDTDNMTINDD